MKIFPKRPDPSDIEFHATNANGTRWWKHKSGTAHANREVEGYPDLQDFSVWYVNDQFGIESFVATHGHDFFKVEVELEVLYEECDKYRLKKAST